MKEALLFVLILQHFIKDSLSGFYNEFRDMVTIHAMSIGNNKQLLAIAGISFSEKTVLVGLAWIRSQYSLHGSNSISDFLQLLELFPWQQSFQLLLLCLFNLIERIPWFGFFLTAQVID